MNRRKALKNIGLGAGFLVLGPSTLKLLQACSSEKGPNWEPVFLSEADGLILEKLLDIILPPTDTPGASDLNLAQFVDSYMQEVASGEQQEMFRRGVEDFKLDFKGKFEKDISEGNEKEYHEILTGSFKATPERQGNKVRRTTETQDPLDKDPDEKRSFEEGGTFFLETVRELGIWGWKNSEVIGEEVLWYDPVPGVYIPCGSVGELGNGRAMSL